MSDQTLKNPHDHYFRGMMSDPKIIREFFEQNLPAHIRAVINYDTIYPQKDSFVDDHLRLQIADILYSAEFSGKAGYLYLLLEHQSTPCELMAFRTLKYMIAIMDSHLKKTGTNRLPVIYPIIIYNGWKDYKYSTDIFDLFGDDKELAKDILWKPYQLVDLSKIPDEKLKASIRYGIVAYTMKHIHNKNFLPILKSIINELKPIEEHDDMDYIYKTLSYIIEASEINKQDFINVVKTGLSISGEKVMTLAEQFRQEGMQEGVQLGKQEGLQLGKQAGILEGLQKGKLEAVKVIATNLFKKGMTVNQVSEFTGLPIFDAEKLKTKI